MKTQVTKDTNNNKQNTHIGRNIHGNKHIPLDSQIALEERLNLIQCSDYLEIDWDAPLAYSEEQLKLMEVLP